MNGHRYHDMDAMRGVMMVMGIVLHASQVFSADRLWHIYSVQSSSIADILVDVIHAFRMPAFFTLAGFFAALTVRRHGIRALITIRMQRLLVPFVVVAATLNVAQLMLLQSTGWRHYTRADIAAGAWVLHLWFLANLAVYFVLAFVAIRLGNAQLARLGQVLGRLPAQYLTLLPLAALAPHALGMLGFPVYTDLYGVVRTFNVLTYAPYFAVGALLFVQPVLMQKIRSMSVALMLTLVTISTVIIANVGTDSTISFAITTYFSSLRTWAAIFVCFQVFAALFSQQSTIGSYLASASYTVYLIHHFCVVLFGLILIRIGIGGTFGLFLLIGIVGATSFAIHHWIVAPSAVLTFLLNGER